MSQLPQSAVLIAVLVTAASLHFTVPIRAASDSKYIWHLSSGGGTLDVPVKEEQLKQLAANQRPWLEDEWKDSMLASLHLKRHAFSDDAEWEGKEAERYGSAGLKKEDCFRYDIERNFFNDELAEQRWTEKHPKTAVNESAVEEIHDGLLETASASLHAAHSHDKLDREIIVVIWDPHTSTSVHSKRGKFEG